MSAKRILLVEDEENFGALLQNYLKLSKYEVDWMKDGATGYSLFSNNHYDLCIFDVMMPNIDGFTLLEKIRKKKHTTPVIYLTAKTMKEDIMKGYQLGAVDYLTKPFDIEVLLMKIKAIFELGDNKSIPTEENYQVGQFNYDVKKRLLKHKIKNQKLSPKEGALFTLLCQHFDDVLPREKALLEIWKEDNYFTTRSMDVYITKLRKYLKQDKSVSIENVHSSGYRLYVDD
ncbi:MAG: DNA-binding response regulator [Fluviicola sp.]|nr:MAG: DNA-binding response regulator [Fluviicola sp.]